MRPPAAGGMEQGAVGRVAVAPPRGSLEFWGEEEKFWGYSVLGVDAIAILDLPPVVADTCVGPGGRKKAFPENFKVEISSSLQNMTHFRRKKQNNLPGASGSPGCHRCCHPVSEGTVTALGRRCPVGSVLCPPHWT